MKPSAISTTQDDNPRLNNTYRIVFMAKSLVIYQMTSNRFVITYKILEITMQLYTSNFEHLLVT